MRTLLICHSDAALTRDGISRWMASFSDLAGIVVLEESHQRVFKRFRRELRRVGFFRFPDVFAFRLYYRLFLASKDREWEAAELQKMRSAYPDVPEDVPVLTTHSPNSHEARAFIESVSPDIVIARCKTLINESVFSIPSKGTFVMHPGICPEYRNAHGCFWALANDDRGNVGMTLLKIDKGVDTGPIYGYYSYDFDELNESPIVIQQRVVMENLPRIQDKLVEIYHGTASPIDPSDRRSATWGQPWLTRYLRLKQKARKRRR